QRKILVLLPVPVGGELRQAPEALLAFAQRRLGPLSLGDVVEDRDLVERPPRAVALEHHAEGDPHHRAVLAQVALLDMHVVDLAGVEARSLRVDDFQILRMRDVAPGHADQLVLGIPEDLAKAPVYADELAVKADVRDARAGELEGAAVARFALAQALFGLFPCRDVVEHRDGVERPAGAIALQRDGDARPHGGAVLAQVALLQPHGVDLAGDELLAPLVDAVAVLRVRDVLDRHADELRLAVAEKLAKAPVDAQVAAV